MRKLNYIKIPLVLTGLYFVYPTQVAHADELAEPSHQNSILQEGSQTSQTGEQEQVDAVSRHSNETQTSTLETNQQNKADTYDTQDDEAENQEANEVEENKGYDTSQDPNFDTDGDLIDNRRKLTGNEVKPETAVVHTDNANYTGQIESLKGGDGTGAVIGKNLVLTAGHVLYNNNSPRDYMTGGYVIPGKDGDKEPYGRFKIKAMHVPERYEETPWRKYDMGIIELEPNEKGQSIGDLIPPYRIKQFDRSMIGQKVYSQGYPADKNPVKQNQWHADGKIIQVQDQGTIEYSMHNSEGQSGGPVLLDKTREIIAVHTYGTLGNQYGTLGTPITSELYDWISSFIDKEGPIKSTEETEPQQANSSQEQSETNQEDHSGEVATPEKKVENADDDIHAVAPTQDKTEENHISGGVTSSEQQEEKTQDDAFVPEKSSEHQKEKTKDNRELSKVQDKILKTESQQTENNVLSSVQVANASDVAVKTVPLKPVHVVDSNMKPVTTESMPQFKPKMMQISYQASHMSSMQGAHITSHHDKTTVKQLPQTGETNTSHSFLAGFSITILGFMLLRFRRKIKNL
ncbi:MULTISPECIES: trypsin-like serine protease [unclassified Staphylococcus]|uniref:trypsin-like serine protease n=1 Tax=unclassified Staphylococcus TaxID=91994 RepID=UPI0021D11D20|nr:MULTISPECIES: trypsin-like serine protease [unclassified Staphylococcus]UXR71603.1 trypsin-like serine protease [Staphylococcus sp. IVB6240]UXR73877.1 trypsin-like serine protease [Staphylococcus sp. IVB6238]UXR76200.1 trypsin-like serine protease [Staphylococcus sp. IVB6233]UXR80397.1 trypsin-like serine protease [Staphylococcus sp. IVB6218]